MKKNPKKAPPPKTYIIRDRKDRELGESSGPSKEDALVELFRRDPECMHITPAVARQMVKDSLVRFTLLA